MVNLPKPARRVSCNLNRKLTQRSAVFRYTVEAYNSLVLIMEKSCSFVGAGGISCGESRGLQEISC